jgi:hypothetical protein
MYAFLMKTRSVFGRFSMDSSRKSIRKYAFSNENALVWTGPYTDHDFRIFGPILIVSHKYTMYEDAGDLP